MNNKNNSDDINIEISENAKQIISEMRYCTKHKLLEIDFSDKYNQRNIKSFVNSFNIQKSLKDLQKKIKQGIPNIAPEDLMLIDEIILENIRIFDIENVNKQSNPEKDIVEERPDISFEEWEKTLQEKYEVLRETTLKCFPEVWQAIEFTLSVKNVLHIKGNTLPFAGIIMGPPSSSKTLALEMLRKSKMTFYTDSFTAKSFVSHVTNVNPEMLTKIDMLPRIENKLFLTPELAPLFSAKDEDLLNVLGIVTRYLMDMVMRATVVHLVIEDIQGILCSLGLEL